jgi:hypothetical protein
MTLSARLCYGKTFAQIPLLGKTLLSSKSSIAGRNGVSNPGTADQARPSASGTHRVFSRNSHRMLHLRTVSPSLGAGRTDLSQRNPEFHAKTQSENQETQRRPISKYQGKGMIMCISLRTLRPLCVFTRNRPGDSAGRSRWLRCPDRPYHFNAP